MIAILNQLENEISNVLANLNAESTTFEVECEGWTANVNYNVEIGTDDGDYWTAPSWWVERESVEIEVYNEESEYNKEVTYKLNKLFN